MHVYTVYTVYAQYMHASNCTNPFAILSKNIYKNIYFNRNIFKIYIMCFHYRGKRHDAGIDAGCMILDF